MVAIILYQQFIIYINKKESSKKRAALIDENQAVLNAWKNAINQTHALSDQMHEMTKRFTRQSDEIQKLRIECQVHLKNVRRFAGSWAEPTKQNTSYASVFKRVGATFPIHETVKILHDFGVTFDGIGLIQFKDLMVLLK